MALRIFITKVILFIFSKTGEPSGLLWKNQRFILARLERTYRRGQGINKIILTRLEECIVKDKCHLNFFGLFMQKGNLHFKSFELSLITQPVYNQGPLLAHQQNAISMSIRRWAESSPLLFVYSDKVVAGSSWFCLQVCQGIYGRKQCSSRL